MKNVVKRSLALFLSCTSLFLVGCGDGDSDGNSSLSHPHVFDQEVVEDKYLASAATCDSPATYYMSCTCGEKDVETFTHGKKLGHSYTATVEKDEYLKTPANCTTGTVYYKSCARCGKKSSMQVFTVPAVGDHVFSQERADWEYIKEEATKETAAVYYKSCKYCGEKGTETFTSGEPLKTYTDEEKLAYTPTSLTMSLYDTAETVYAFTYNTDLKPLRPVIQIAKGNSLTGCEEVMPLSVTPYKALSPGKNASDDATADDETITIYTVKTTVDLEPSTTYTYRVYDKYVDVGTTAVTFKTKAENPTSFSFAHVSDTQCAGSSTGLRFGRVLSMLETNGNDFLIHTGDVVQRSKYETQWDDMIGDNFDYLSKIPMMMTTGNHGATSHYAANIDYALDRHFAYKLPQQASTAKGAYYSFEYGNAKFIMLNTNDNVASGALKSEQFNWLKTELQNNTCDWTFVALHCPLYSAGRWGSQTSDGSTGQTVALRKQLGGLFAEYGVDVVLQGHDHLVTRTHPIDAEGKAQTDVWQEENGVQYSVDPNGVIYVMNGPGGDQTRGVHAEHDPSHYYYKSSSRSCSWAEFKVEGNKLTVTAQSTSNGKTAQTYYQWGITKTLETA